MSLSNPFSRFTLFVPFALVVLALAFGVFLFRAAPPSATLSSQHVAQARLAPGTDALLKQTAQHLSKLLGGASVGGFRPFRPPDDDERFKEKIKNRSYNAQEFDYWLKEINNFLNQVANKNPRLTLQEILRTNGASQTEIDSYLLSLRRVYLLARESESAGGVTALTVKTFETVLMKLGVTL